MKNAKEVRKNLNVRRKYKDVLFQKIFSDKKVLLELYNAVNGTRYADEEDLIVYTIDDSVYMGYKNDLSFLICGVLNLYEHQSTQNPNLPLRGVLYFARQYEAYVKQNHLNLYGQTLIKLPYPQYLIFYNGSDGWMENKDKKELFLSDAFVKPLHETEGVCLECRAIVYNINFGHNRELMKRCKTLEEYAVLAAKIRSCLSDGKTIEMSVEQAVQECICEGILEKYLLKHRAEVAGMLLEEFDMDEFLKMDRRDERAAGREEGRRAVAEAVLDVLGIKYEVPWEMRERILSEPCMEVLKAWMHSAIRVKSLEEFESMIRNCS